MRWSAVLFSVILGVGFHYVQSGSSFANKIVNWDNQTIAKVDQVIAAFNGLRLPKQCNRVSHNVSCCSNVPQNYSLCKSAATTDDSVIFRVHLKGRLLVERVLNSSSAFDPPPLCTPFPPLPIVVLCFDINNLYKSKDQVSACFQVTVGVTPITLVSMNLNCVKVENGTLYITPPQQGSATGLINFNIPKSNTPAPKRIFPPSSGRR